MDKSSLQCVKVQNSQNSTEIHFLKKYTDKASGKKIVFVLSSQEIKSLHSFKYTSGFILSLKIHSYWVIVLQQPLFMSFHTCGSTTQRVITGQTPDLKVYRVHTLPWILTLLQARTQPWMTARFHSCKDKQWLR